MRILFLIIIFSVIVGCNTTEKRDIELVRGTAIIEGKVSNYENSSEVISFIGNSILGDISQTAIIDSSGNFRTEIELLNPQNVTLSYENGWAYLYLNPKDSLFIELDSNSLEQDRYEISGSNPSTSNYIRDFFKFHGNFNYEPKYGDSVSVREYLSALGQQLNVEDSILTEFSKQYKPNEEFMNWAKMNTKYRYSGALLLYYWHFDVNRKQLKPEIFDTDLFPVDDDSAIVSGNYIVHLKNYTMIKYVPDSLAIEIYEKKGVVASFNYVFDKIINNEKPGLSRDIMIYYFLLRVLENPIADLDLGWESYVSFIYNDLIVNMLNGKKHLLENQKMMTETTLDLISNSNSEIVKNFWETLSAKHKGKIIYIDIWATWCGFCLDEIPDAIDLQNYFEGKQIAFVNLCMASKKEDWEKSLIQHHIKGDNYFFNKDETVILRNELKFHGYPTYIIIDKNGKIIDKNAPRPSSGKEIIKYLNKLLNKYG